MKREVRRLVAELGCVLTIVVSAACSTSDDPARREAIRPPSSDADGATAFKDAGSVPAPVFDASIPPETMLDAAIKHQDSGTQVVPPTLPESPIFVGAGDIAHCPSQYDEQTATLLDGIPGTVFTLGDNVYQSGTEQEFKDCFEPSWGRHKARMRPTVGNHEYVTRSGAPYYAYFGESAGPAGKGYYSYDLGAWHIVALNSQIDMRPSSEQGKWLSADLVAHDTKCTLAYMHYPRFSSGDHGDIAPVEDLWQILYDRGVDVVLAGHDHHYERFAPQDPQGKADPAGIREFIVGTGGKTLRAAKGKANTEVVNDKAFGVLKLVLNPTSYEWTFVPVPGATFTDQGMANCH